MLYYIFILIFVIRNVYSFIHHIPSTYKSIHHTPYTRSFSKEAKDLGFQADFTRELNPTILNNLRKIGIEQFNEIQNNSIPRILDDSVKNLCILSQTGTGKTVSYLVPIIEMILKTKNKEPKGVILVPNGILIYQVYDVLKNLTKDLPINVKTVDDVETGKIPDLVISSPSKLIDKFEAYKLNYKIDPFEFINYLVLDEVDQLFIHKEVLMDILKRSKNRLKTILSSSTLPSAGNKSDSKTLSSLFQKCEYIKSEDLHRIPEKVSIEFIHYQSERDKFENLVDYIKDKNNRILIYCNNSTNCEKLYSMLSKLGKNVHLLSKNVDLMEQLLILSRADRKMIIISTDVSSRGVDFKNINTVIHYDFPTNVVNFIHRTGRVGRNGNYGKCLSFWSDSDEFLKNKIEENLEQLSEVFSRRRSLRKKFNRAEKAQEINVT